METKNLLITLLDGPEALLYAVPTLRAIRENYKDANITLVADRFCEELVDFLPPGIAMGTVLSPNDPLPENLYAPDLLIQLGLSQESLALSEKIRAAEITGPYKENGRLCYPYGWDRYAAIAKEFGRFNPIHNVDLLRNLSGENHDEYNFELRVPSGLNAALGEYLSNDGEVKVAISLEDQDPEELQAAIKAILALDLRLKIYLFGTVKEHRLSSTITAQIPRTEIVDLCGRLSLRESAALTYASDIVLCAPGLNAALSAGFGTFCICLDPSQGAEFSRYPYGHGHLILQRNKANFSAEGLGATIAEIIQFTVNGKNGVIPNREDWQSYFDSRIDSLLGKLRVFNTQRVQYLLEMGKSRTDLQLHPLLFTGSDFSDCMRSFYRLLWENFLSGISFEATNLEILHEDSLRLLSELHAPLERIYELAEFGRKYVSCIKKHLLEKNLEKMKADSQRLQEVDDLIRALSLAYPALLPIYSYIALSQAQGPGTEIHEVAEEFDSIYRDLQHHVLILLDLQKSLYQTTYEKEKLLQPPQLDQGGPNGQPANQR